MLSLQWLRRRRPSLRMCRRHATHIASKRVLITLEGTLARTQCQHLIKRRAVLLVSRRECAMPSRTLQSRAIAGSRCAGAAHGLWHHQPLS
jgi:hypothetical protein